MCFGCANIAPPSGGPKDYHPPKLLFAEPPNQSTNFKSKSITLVFNEYLQIKNIADIRISPKCSESLKITLKTNKLNIDLPRLLKPNTTYTINFGKSILDLNEGNAIENFKYVFSTGNVLDSFFVVGKTYELYSGKSLKNTLVGLYKNFDSISTSIPFYYSFSDEKGEFLIDNIKNDNYVLCAINDENSNLIYDYGEQIGYTLRPINLNEDKSVGLFTEETSLPIKKVYQIDKRGIRFEHEPMYLDSLFIINNRGLWDKNNRVSTFWFENTPKQIKYTLSGFTDSIELDHNYLDSTDLKIYSTFNAINLSSQKDIILKTTKPIKDIDSTKFKWLSRDNLINLEKINNFSIKIPLDFQLINEEKLLVSSGAILDNYGEKTDSLLVDLDLRPDQYGRLKITCDQTPPNTILEIFNEKGTIAQKSLKDSVQINFILPGDYKIRAFQDLNGDQLWTSGKLENKTLPEPIMVYPEQINIRQNWIVELQISPPK